MASPYDTDLDRNAANFEPLSPLTFLARAAHVYPNHTAVIHGERRYDYAALYARCRRLASALTRRGLGLGDTVAIIATNIPAHLEAHFGVPMAGCVLNAINIRLDAAAIAFILEHGETKLLLVDREFAPVAKAALAQIGRSIPVIDIDDAAAPQHPMIGEKEYEQLLLEGDEAFAWSPPKDEWQAISLNYTSGTTGNPKGVVYHHRGAYLNAIGNVLTWSMPQHPVYLWTLPMFHCNGWCFPWTVTAQAGTHVCLRRVDARPIYEALKNHGVTYFNGAPIVLNLLVNAPAELREGLRPGICVGTAGAAPPAAIIAGMENLKFKVTHLYGLTETYGPATVCAWKDEWDEKPLAERAKLKARQGVRYTVLEDLTVMNPETVTRVPADGLTMGVVMFRGNVVMKGYLKNAKATREAFAGGWFHSGDLGVLHPDGYIELKDRSKDIIISGGENISTIEVESVLYQHPAIMEAAVVARPDEKWGETPCAFVNLKPGASATAEEIIEYCRQNMAKFKAPKTIVFSELPKTSTGKIQKFVLRDRAKAL